MKIITTIAFDLYWFTACPEWPLNSITITVKSRYLEVDGTIFYKFRLLKVQKFGLVKKSPLRQIMVREGNWNVFFIHIDASSFAVLEISEFKISRFDSNSLTIMFVSYSYIVCLVWLYIEVVRKYIKTKKNGFYIILLHKFHKKYCTNSSYIGKRQQVTINSHKNTIWHRLSNQR